MPPLKAVKPATSAVGGSRAFNRSGQIGRDATPDNARFQYLAGDLQRRDDGTLYEAKP